MALQQAAPALSVERLVPSAWAARASAASPPLGALGYGGPVAAADPVCARVLSAAGPMVDAWGSTEPVVEGLCGRVRWRHGHWLYGALELDQTTEDLATLVRDAYRDIFATLRQTGCTHLQRVWNYLPRINAEENGLERYRAFNTGRQAAFLEARYPAFEGAPAACAIGTRSGPFCVRFLAGARAPVPVENPRQVSAYRYPVAYGPTSPTFSRAALLQASTNETALLISGTASIVGHASLHVGDVQAQTREALANLQAVIAAAHRRCSARHALADLQCVVYVRHAEHAPLVRAVIDTTFGAGSPAARGAVFLEADICRADLLVEIEAHGIAAGRVHA